MTDPGNIIEPDNTEPNPERPWDLLTLLVRAAWVVGLAAIGIAAGLWLWHGGSAEPPGAPAAAEPSQAIPEAMRPDAMAPAALEAPPFHIQRNTDAAKHLFDDLGLDVHPFRIKTRPNRRVLLWVELYESGELQEDRSFGVMYEPQPGRPVQGALRFTRLDPRAIREDGGREPGRVRWTLGIGSSAQRRWLEDPLAGHPHRGSMPETETTWELGSGRTHTLWYLAAAGGGDEADAAVRLGASEPVRRGNERYLTLRCRVEPADPERSGATFKTLSEVPPE